MAGSAEVGSRSAYPVAAPQQSGDRPYSASAESRPTEPQLPPTLVRLLESVHAAELTASGATRRSAWRTTRDVLGGVLAAGYSIRDVADSLGISIDSVRTRATRDGWISADAIVMIAGADPATITRWWAEGSVTKQRRRSDGAVEYAMVEVVRALVATAPDRSTKSSQGTTS